MDTKIKVAEIKELPLYLRAREAQALLGLSPWVLYRMAYSGEIKSIRVARTRLFLTKDLLRLLKNE